ncbi:MAG: alpha-amylase family glycosyl hydrolase [Pyrinomonadaceae bacterium]
MRKKLRSLGFLLLALPVFWGAVSGQTPTVSKVEPPNWWNGMTINPVRLLITGKNLKDARVFAPAGSGLKASNLSWSENGDYLFFDLEIAPGTKVGKYNLKIQTEKGYTDAAFEISQRLDRKGRFQGYSTDDVIYAIMPDRFADGDRSNNDPAKSKGLYNRKEPKYYHGGDLQGIIDHLSYLKSLGVTAIWTMPVYDNNDSLDYIEKFNDQPTTGYHGYGAIDMYGVDEHMGDMAKLRELIDKAHAMGFKMIQDQVVNHTGPYHPWAKNTPTPTWWNGTWDKHLSNNWQKWTGMNPRASYQTQKSNLEGWFIDILPDFNQHDPEVEKYLIQHTIWWLEMTGFDAIRMDTLPHVPRSFWTLWMAAVKREYPRVNVLGELFDGDPALLAYYQTGRIGRDGIDTGIDTLYDFGLFYEIRKSFAGGGEIRGVSKMLAHDWLYPDPTVLTTFLGVHDMERFMSVPGATTDGLKLAQTFLMTVRGTPLLYYGDEIAMRGEGDPDNRRDFPGGFAGDSRSAFSSTGRTSEENEVWNHVALLGKLRAELEPLRRGRSLDLLDEPQQSAFARITAKEAVIVVFNNDPQPAEVSFDISMIKQIPAGAVLVDRLGNIGQVKPADGIFRITVPGRSAGIFGIK